METLPEYLTIPAAIARFGISRSQFYRLFAAGELRPVKIGSRTLIATRDLRAFFENAPRAEFRAPATTKAP